MFLAQLAASVGHHEVDIFGIQQFGPSDFGDPDFSSSTTRLPFLLHNEMSKTTGWIAFAFGTNTDVPPQNEL